MEGPPPACASFLQEDEEEMTLVIKDVRGGLDPSFPLMSWYDAQSTDSPPSDRQLSIVETNIDRVINHLTADGCPSSEVGSMPTTESEERYGPSTRTGGSFMCTICRRNFDSATELHEHMGIAHVDCGGNAALDCPFCGKLFPKYVQLEDHIAQLHGDGSITCKGCHAVFQRSSQLRKHQQCCQEYIQLKQPALYNENSTYKHDHAENSGAVEDHTVSAMHIADHHTDDWTADDRHAYRCEGCGVGCTHLTTLALHQSTCQATSELYNLTNQSHFTGTLRCQACCAEADDITSFQDHKENCSVWLTNVGQSEVSHLHTNLNATTNQKAKMVDDLTTAQSNRCPVCLISFQYKSLKEFHMTVHVEPESKPLQCGGCGAGFFNRSHLADHMGKCGKVVLSDEADTEKCGNEYRNCGNGISAGIVIPKSPTESSSPSTCAMKGLKMVTAVEPSYSTKDGLDSQTGTYKQSHVVSQFKCVACLKTYHCYRDLVSHLPACQSMSGYLSDDGRDSGNNTTSSTGSECPQCHLVFARKDKLESHLKGHSAGSDNKYRCSGCGWSILRLNLIIEHVKKCPLFIKKWKSSPPASSSSCPICLSAFVSSKSLKQHILNCHVGLYKDPSSSRCDGCFGSFGSEGALTLHQERCRAYARRLESADPDSTCGVCLVQTSAIDAHFTRYHIIKDTSSIRCGICGDMFSSISELISHSSSCLMLRAMLQNQSPFDKLRSKTLDMSPNSQKTMGNDTSTNDMWEELSCSSTSTKNGSEKTGCTLCGIVFSRAHMQRHLYCHSEEAAKVRQHQCLRCNGHFISVFHLQRHMKACKQFEAASPMETKESTVNGLVCLSDQTRPSMKVNMSELSEMPRDIELSESEISTDILSCQRCMQEFSSSQKFITHKAICQAKSQSVSDDYDDDDDRAKPAAVEGHGDKSDDSNVQADTWKCLSCGIRFQEELPFLLHIASHEISDVKNCVLCHASFRTAADICMHLVVHHKLFLTTGVKSESDSKIQVDKTLAEVRVSITPTTVDLSKTETTVPVEELDLDLGNTKEDPDLEDVDLRSTTSTPETPATVSFALPKFHHERLTGVRCPVCKRTFNSNAILKKHFGIHDGYYRSVCLVCGIGFSKNSLLKTHKMKCHRSAANAAKELTCSKCDGHFDSKIRLQKHMELCICPKNDEQPQCILCPDQFKSWTHVCGHHPKHFNRCSFCAVKMPSRQKFVVHMRSCSKNPLSKHQRSTDLNEASKTKSNKVKAAVKTQSPSNPSRDIRCPSKDIRRPSRGIRRPSRKMRPKVAKIKCNQCCYEAPNRRTLRKHQEQHQRAEYRCRVCGGKFKTLISKNRHMLREHKASTKMIRAAARSNLQSPSDVVDLSKDDPVSISDTAEADLKPETVSPAVTTFFACHKCDIVFETKEQRENHEAAVHPAASAKSFCCRLCDKSFTSKFARRRHMQKCHSAPVTQVRNQTCHLCGKRFQSNFANLQHLKKRHNIADPATLFAGNTRPRVCKYCGASFGHKSELKAHKIAKHGSRSTQPPVGASSVLPDLPTQDTFVSEHTPPLPATSNHQPPLPATSNHQPPLPATSNHQPPLPATSNHKPPPPATSNHKPLSPATSNLKPSPPAKADYKPPLLVTVDKSLPPATFNSEPPLPVIADYKPLPARKCGKRLFPNDGSASEKVDKLCEHADSLPPCPTDNVAAAAAVEESVTPAMHAASRKQKACKECGQFFESKVDLRIHKRQAHKDRKQMAVFTSAGTISLVARSAAVSTVSAADNLHLQGKPSSPPMKRPKLASEPASQACNSGGSSDSSRPFTCDVCQKAFKYRISLNQHINKVHGKQ